MDPPPPSLCPPDYSRWEGSYVIRTEGLVQTKTSTYTFTLRDGSRVSRAHTATVAASAAAAERPPDATFRAALAQCPTPTNAAGLRAAYESYGLKVGDGQCFALGAAARAASAPEGPKGLGAEVPLEDALPGDILQFSWCKFFRREAEGASFVSYYAGDEKSHGEHTAVVFAVERRAPLRAIALEQNINGRLCVTHRVYDFSEMTHGKCVAYRGR
jgi:hypothetical protein